MTIASRSALARLSPMALLLVAGCAADDRYPSLSPRPIERQAAAEPAGDAGPPAAVAADAALVTRIAVIDRTAQAADRAFAAATEAAAQAVARPGAGTSGSDAWIAAQTRYSAAVAARGALQDAADALDTLRRDRENGNDADLAALDAAAGRIDRLGAAADARLATLSARLGD